MKKTLFVLIVGLTVLSSCTFNQKTYQEGDYPIPDSLFSFFSDELFKFFTYQQIPRKPDNRIFFESEQIIGYQVVELHKTRYENSKILPQLISEYRLQSLLAIKSEDTDYFVIDYVKMVRKEYDTLQLKEWYLTVENKIISSFENVFTNSPDLHAVLYDSTTISGLPVGYEILVLKSGNKFVLPSSYLYDWSVLPENLKHGYRSGVAFKEDEPYIIYWAVAW